jgi:hypothetical protein
MVTLQDAKSVTADLAKRFNPVFIFIFGSVARNGAGNDLDMLIVVDDAKNDINETNRKIQVHLIPYFNHFSIDPFIVGLTAARKRLQNGSPFLDSILKDAVLLYSRYPAEVGLLPQGEPGKKDAEYAICSAEKVAKGIRG